MIATKEKNSVLGVFFCCCCCFVSFIVTFAVFPWEILGCFFREKPSATGSCYPVCRWKHNEKNGFYLLFSFWYRLVAVFPWEIWGNFFPGKAISDMVTLCSLQMEFWMYIASKKEFITHNSSLHTIRLLYMIPLVIRQRNDKHTAPGTPIMCPWFIENSERVNHMSPC